MPELTFPTVIDNTIRSAFVKCPTYWQYSFIRNLASPLPNVHLHAGGAFAAGVEATRRAFYEGGLPADIALSEGVRALCLAYGDFEPPATGTGANKTPERMIDALRSYFEEAYPLATDVLTPFVLPSGRRAIEFSFGLPLEIKHPDSGDPIIYAGRFDMLAHRDDALFVVDEKTTSQLGASWVSQWDLDSQFTGYCWGARHFDYPVAGAVVRGISLLKGGCGHAQAIVYRPEWQIARWYEQLEFDIEQMITQYTRLKNGKPTSLALDKSACGGYGGCTFAGVCASPHPEAWLATDFVPRNWNPLAIRG